MYTEMMFNGFFLFLLTGVVFCIEGVRGGANPNRNVYGSSSASSAVVVGGFPQSAGSLGVVFGGGGVGGGGTGTIVVTAAGTGSTGRYGERHHGGVVIGSGGYGQQGSNCRYWCRTPSKQYYCCESSNQNPGHANENLATLISEIRSDVEALRNDLLVLKPKAQEEDTVEQVSLDKLSENNVAKGESECSFGETELIGSGRSLLQYLQRVDFNVFLGKPSNASSTYPTTTIESAVDGSFVTLFHTNKEAKPWFYVDLLVPHLIWEITITLREATRAGGIRVYVAKSMVFDTYGKPDDRNLPLFASQVGDSRKTDLKYTYAGGMCGRYVVVKREVASEYLIFFEIQGVGFKF